MILRYMANIVEKHSSFLNRRGTLDHPRIHTHTNKTIQENKQNIKNRTQDFLRFSKVGHRPHLAFSDSLIDEQ